MDHGEAAEPRPVFALDDTEADLSSIERAYRRIDADAELRCFSSAHDLFAVLEPGPGDDSAPAYLLLDMNMPETDGLAILRQMRRDHAHVPVVMLSGSARPHERAEAYRSGAAGFVEKPFGVAELTAKLAVVHAYWTETCEPTTGSDHDA